jgi:hypothetical protein
MLVNSNNNTKIDNINPEMNVVRKAFLQCVE